MLVGTCHCGAVRVEVPFRPRMLTNCNCSICRRYGVLWAYYKASSVRVISDSGATQSYSWGRKALRFVRCKECGCVMNWTRVRPRKDDYMGVNARTFESKDLEGVRVRMLDGADTWKYID
ncbi:MAG: GFA family protein [Gammaproteobacteria bacterium]